MIGTDAISNLLPLILSFTRSIWVPISKVAFASTPSSVSNNDNSLFPSKNSSSFSSDSSLVPDPLPSTQISNSYLSPDSMIPTGHFAIFESPLDFLFQNKKINSNLFGVGETLNPLHTVKLVPSHVSPLDQALFDIFSSVEQPRDLSLRILKCTQESMGLTNFCYQMIEYAVWKQDSFRRSLHISDTLSPTIIAQLMGAIIALVCGWNGIQFVMLNIFPQIIDQVNDNQWRIGRFLNLVSAALLLSCLPICPTQRSDEMIEPECHGSRSLEENHSENLIRKFFQSLLRLMRRASPSNKGRLSTLVHQTLTFFEGTGWLAYLDSAQMSVFLNFSLDQSDSIRRIFDWTTFEGQYQCLKFICALNDA